MQVHSLVEQTPPGCAQVWYSIFWAFTGNTGLSPESQSCCALDLSLCPGSRSVSWAQAPDLNPCLPSLDSALPLQSSLWFCSLWTSSHSSASDFFISFLFVCHFGFVAFQGRLFLMLEEFQTSVSHLCNSRDAKFSDKRVFYAFFLYSFLSGLDF